MRLYCDRRFSRSPGTLVRTWLVNANSDRLDLYTATGWLSSLVNTTSKASDLLSTQISGFGITSRNLSPLPMSAGSGLDCATIGTTAKANKTPAHSSSATPHHLFISSHARSSHSRTRLSPLHRPCARTSQCPHRPDHAARFSSILKASASHRLDRCTS